jgi:hypothetical protein
MAERSLNIGPNQKPKTRRSEALVERDIAIYRRQMSGLSIRAICDEFGLKSTNTVHAAIQRGKEHVKERGIDVEERRIQIDELFKDTLGMLAQQARHQFQHGTTITTTGPDGPTTKHIPGIDTRLAGELSRSLHRWADFLGLCEAAPEQNVQATTVVLTQPSDGASFESRWATPEGQTVDATATPVTSPDSEAGAHALHTNQQIAPEKPHQD